MEAISATEAAHRAASDQERVAWVDENDRLLGGVSRAELRERRLIGRGTYILLFNTAGLLCVHRRTLSKALYPGYWDVAAGGMVLEGEDYRLRPSVNWPRNWASSMPTWSSMRTFSMTLRKVACGA